MAKFISSFRVPGTRSIFKRIRVIRRFLKLYLGTLRDTYKRQRRRRWWRRHR